MLYIVYIVSFGNKNNILFNYIKNLIDKEGDVLDDYIKNETDERSKAIKTTQEEIDKVKSKIEEINNEKPKDESLDQFFDKRLQ
jgi:adenine-specific DNA methylase